jgi:hypothetical protein
MSQRKHCEWSQLCWRDIKPRDSSGITPRSLEEMSSLLRGKANSLNFHAVVKKYFIPRKQIGKVVIHRDGHISRCSEPDMLELAQESGIMMVCLPLYSIHYLQHLDRCFFRPLKHFFLQGNARLGTISPRSQSIKSALCTVAEGGIAEICNLIWRVFWNWN